MTRVIHTGDTHLGYRQYHRPERREDFLAAFERVADDAIEADVDAVVHAGDLFHDRRPGLPDILGALSVLRDLDDAGVPFLAIVGNHETKRDAQWLDLFESLGVATRLGADPVRVGNTALYGLDFVPQSRREDLDYDFAPHDAEHAALVAHGLFEPFEFAEWDTERLLAESSVDFDALLLGDNHAPQTAEVDGTWVTYCGSTERASADERDERGYNVVEFDDGVDIRRRGLPTREFVFVDVELREGEGVERVRQAVGEYDLDDAVVVVSVEGEGDPFAPAHVEEYADEQGALVARVTDHREVADDEDVAVSFADPDDAVRERVRDLGLSEAARDLDETVRASAVADSNVADEVERRVRERIEEGVGLDGADGEGGASDEGSDGGPGESEDRQTGEEMDGDPAGNGEDPSTEEADDGPGGGTEESHQGTDGDGDADDGPDGGQVTMGEYE